MVGGSRCQLLTGRGANKKVLPHSAIRDAAQWVGLDMGNLQIGMMLGGFPGGSVVKNLPAVPET